MHPPGGFWEECVVWAENKASPALLRAREASWLSSRKGVAAGLLSNTQNCGSTCSCLPTVQLILSFEPYLRVIVFDFEEVYLAKRGTVFCHALLQG